MLFFSTRSSDFNSWGLFYHKIILRLVSITPRLINQMLIQIFLPTRCLKNSRRLNRQACLPLPNNLLLKIFLPQQIQRQFLVFMNRLLPRLPRHNWSQQHPFKKLWLLIQHTSKPRNHGVPLSPHFHFTTAEAEKLIRWFKTYEFTVDNTEVWDYWAYNSIAFSAPWSSAAFAPGGDFHDSRSGCNYNKAPDIALFSQAHMLWLGYYQEWVDNQSAGFHPDAATIATFFALCFANLLIIL